MTSNILNIPSDLDNVVRLVRNFNENQYGGEYFKDGNMNELYVNRVRGRDENLCVSVDPKSSLTIVYKTVDNSLAELDKVMNDVMTYGKVKEEVGGKAYANVFGMLRENRTNKVRILLNIDREDHTQRLTDHLLSKGNKSGSFYMQRVSDNTPTKDGSFSGNYSKPYLGTTLDKMKTGEWIGMYDSDKNVKEQRSYCFLAKRNGTYYYISAGHGYTNTSKYPRGRNIYYLSNDSTQYEEYEPTYTTPSEYGRSKLKALGGKGRADLIGTLYAALCEDKYDFMSILRKDGAGYPVNTAYNGLETDAVGGVPVEGATCFFTGSVHRNHINTGYAGKMCTSTMAWFLRRDWDEQSGSDIIKDGIAMIGPVLPGDSGGAMMYQRSDTGKMTICGITANTFGDEAFFTKTQNLFVKYPDMYPQGLDRITT